MPAFASPSISKSHILVTGTNHDTLYTGGWLDLVKGPEIVHVPDMAGRYYSIEFVDPWGGVRAYVGRRTTGTQTGNYFITGPQCKGAVPEGVKQIASPNNSVLLIGRVLVESDRDLATAYGAANPANVAESLATHPIALVVVCPTFTPATSVTAFSGPRHKDLPIFSLF